MPNNPSNMGLLLSNRHRIIAGVCGGIADWLGWSPTWVRILYVLASVLSVGFPGILVYIILWVLMPRAGREALR
jgi:phage shock protein PspC (stress-responsive transcriptional regulator)